MTHAEYFEYERLKEDVRSLSLQMAHATGYDRVVAWDKLTIATSNIIKFEHRVLGLENNLSDTTFINRWSLVNEVSECKS